MNKQLAAGLTAAVLTSAASIAHAEVGYLSIAPATCQPTTLNSLTNAVISPTDGSVRFAAGYTGKLQFVCGLHTPYQGMGDGLMHGWHHMSMRYAGTGAKARVVVKYVRKGVVLATMDSNQNPDGTSLGLDLPLDWSNSFYLDAPIWLVLEISRTATSVNPVLQAVTNIPIQP
jgi:hypothetical protein